MSNRSEYDAQLENLTRSVQEMGNLVVKAVDDAVAALENKDTKRAEEIVKGDETVDREERAIEHTCLTLLLRQQPVASDLRQVSAALKMVTDLERIGDHAADIAEIIPRLSGDGIRIEPDIPAMTRAALEMAKLAIQAFGPRDTELADRVIAMDDEVDGAFDSVKRKLAKDMAGGKPEQEDAAIDQLMIAKYAERIGDHAVNLAQWVKFCATGRYLNERIM